MANIERVFLAPASHSTYQTRWAFPPSGYLDGQSLHLEISLESAGNQLWWVPRAGAFALIGQIALLKDGAQVSYLNRADAFAALRTLSVPHEEAAALEARTRGATVVDVQEVGAPIAQSATTCNQHLVSYRATSIADATVRGTGRPLLPLSHVLDVFRKNARIDLAAGRYELMVTWQNSGGAQPCAAFTPPGGVREDAATTAVSNNARLVFNVATMEPSERPAKPLALRPWMEARFTTTVLAPLVIGTSDSQTLPLRFGAGIPATALFIAFVDNETAPTSILNAATAFGQCYSRRASDSSYQFQLIVNGESILPRPVSQDSERGFELGMALAAAFEPLGARGYSAPLFSGGRGNPVVVTRGHSLVRAVGQSAGPLAYYGFRLLSDGRPTITDAQGIFIQLQRQADAVVGAVPTLTVYAWLVGPVMA